MTGPDLSTRALLAMHRLNQRHPWSHNDHFHPWILGRLPEFRGRALDVGCGRGELVAALAPHFASVEGIDRDPGMRRVASARCAGVVEVSIGDTPLGALTGPYDLITMVAVLHHLPLGETFGQVRRLLPPGGRFLVVGLAQSRSRSDLAWEGVCALTNPLIGLVKHPWPAPPAPPATNARPEMPVADPVETLAEIDAAARRVLPGVRLQRRLGFRYTLEWTA
ncbi:class I SAM-dependent methyltransferase [Parenemella sanctibonifatiensis]|nr:class I SAM-dependent methyltransferase [Parenemella sanctibonifatiensis]